jgi:hypothetical protein
LTNLSLPNQHCLIIFYRKLNPKNRAFTKSDEEPFNAPHFKAYGAPIFLALQAALINYSVHKLLTGFATATFIALIA